MLARLNKTRPFFLKKSFFFHEELNKIYGKSNFNIQENTL